MSDREMTKEQLIKELQQLRRQIAQLQAAEDGRHSARQAFEEQQAFLRQVIDIDPNFIFVKDRAGRFVLVNQAVAEAYGTTVEGLVGKTDADFNPNLEEVEHFRRDDLQTMDSLQEKFIAEEVITDAAGNTRWLQTVKRPLVDGDGVARRILGVSNDITGRKQAEETLRKVQENLERRVEERTAELKRRTNQLRTAAEVSRAASSILNPDQLIQQVVDLVQERFDLYYVGLFLVDHDADWTGEPGQWAVLRAGTGEAGQLMLTAGHKLQIGGQSMIGWCIANRQARIALDVGEEAVRFENPFLPATRSEMALPLIARGQIIGAMTVQSEEESAFSIEDIAVLQTMADQVANAIQTARLYDQAQREIAERVQAEQALVEERNLLRTLIDSLPDYVFVKDAHSRFVINNMAHVHVLGATSQAEVVGKTDFDIFPHELAEQYYADEQAVIRSGQALIDREESTIDPQGRRQWLLTSKVPLRDNQGAVVGLVGISRDITERMQAEEALRASETKYRDLVQTANTVILRLDTQGRVTYFNEFAQSFFGYTADEIIGQPAVGTIVPETESSGRDLAAMIADIVVNPEPYSGNENENMRRDGQRVWLIWANKAILDDAGRIAEVLCVGNDITERRQVEEALRASEERFALAVRGSNDGLWDWDIQNKSLYWSPRLKELLGYADDELEIDFEVFASLLHPDDSQHVGAAIEAHLKRGVAYDVEERLRTKSGEYRWFRARGQAIWDEAGQPVRMVGSTTDITERKLAEAERERLVSALESRSKQLWTAAEVSRAASSILDVNELIQQVVDLVQERFGLYYAGLFLVDETGEWSGEAGKWAVLRAGTGEAGRHMRQAGHKLEVGGQSMIGWCIANQQARIALDVGEEAVRFENPWLPETRSEMALPLIARGWAIGAMTIQSSREAAFSAEDTAMLQTMADQVANAVENARLFEQAQARAEEQAILYRITETVSRSLDMHELLEATLDIVLTALKFDAGLVSLSDEESGKLYLAVQNGLPASMARHLEQKGLANTLCDVVFQTGETLSISDVRLGAPVDVSGVIKQGLYTYAGTPLVYGDKKVGTICFFNRSVRELTAQERSLLEAIGRQIGVGVENTRLFEETRSALAEVEATHRIYLQREWREYLDRRDNLVYEGGLAGALTKDQPAASAGNGGHGAKAELAVPIVLRGQTIGVLGLEDPQGTRQWSAQDQALVEAVSRQLALALENARLLEETQRRAARERLAREITDKMRHASTMDALIQTTVREMAAALGAPNAFLQLSTPPESDR